MADEIITEGASAPPPTLAERVRVVHALRGGVALFTGEMDRRRHQWEIENATRIAEFEACRIELAEQEAALREAAIAGFLETGDKAPTPGLGIRIGTKVTYDHADALRWAIIHGLFLDVKIHPFEAFVKKHLDQAPDSVELRAEPQAFIATDLGKVLEVPE